MNGVWAGIIAAETAAAAAVLIGMHLACRLDKSGSKTSFLLPVKIDNNRYEFTVRMVVTDAVKLSEEAGAWVYERMDDSVANRTCLALEEMLTGIVMANPGRDDVIDVVLRNEDNEIIISLRDMGEEFNPTVYDKTLDYSGYEFHTD